MNHELLAISEFEQEQQEEWGEEYENMQYCIERTLNIPYAVEVPTWI